MSDSTLERAIEKLLPKAYTYFKKPRRLWSGIALALASLVLMVYVLFPVYWMLVLSLMPFRDMLSKPPVWFPKTLYLKNLVQILGDESVILAVRNSAIVATFVTALCMVLGSLAAYAFARLRFPVKRTLFLSILVAQMLPGLVLLIPLFVIMRRLGLLNSYAGLILTYSTFTLPQVIWLLRGFFVYVPEEIEDAARVDGCTRLQAIVRIFLPLSLPGLVSTAIFAFLGAWNEFLFASAIAGSTTKTLPIRIVEYIGRERVAVEYMFPAGILGSLPVLILVLIFQRYIIRGLTEGAVKG
jgi:multiple sugar transport system permease protein